MKNTSLLPFVTKPGRYLGAEYNAAAKSWPETSLRWALIFPDLYEIGMSHQGLQILYHLLNGRQDILAERCYCPDIDAEKLLLHKKLPLASLESGHPLKDFDILGITLPYELCYTNILTILNCAQIPLKAADRNDDHPLILGGGPCALNPEPVADFFDAILIGDGEEAVLEIAECLLRAKQENLTKIDRLHRLAAIEGMYVPSFFQPKYDGNGKITRVSSLKEGYDRVDRRILADLGRIDHLYHPLVPNAKIVHDRLGIEIARGCTRGCRFCQAGTTYRPVRERSPEQIMDLARKGIDNSGFEELALLSLSTGDYSCLEVLLPELMNAFADGFVSVSMPSMRVGTLTPAIMDQIKRVRKTGFTLAPEAGSERLRNVINKGITEADLLATCRDAFSLGWNVMKLYFMIGLPTETPEDVDAIAELAKKAKKEGDRNGRGRRQINVSVGTFVPKPHTPFQWEPQLSLSESRERISRLKEILPPKSCKLKWHDPQMSFLEGVFSRGDRRLADLLEAAWQNGARLDGWSDHFAIDRWTKAAEHCGIKLDDYLRRRDRDEVLPWDHLHSRVDKTFLEKELENAHGLVYTPDCRYHGCAQCGVCDFRSIKPIVCEKQRNRPSAAPVGGDGSEKDPGNPANDDYHFRYMVTYERTGSICYLGHLEMLQLIFRALRRAGIVTNFTQGFNPTPKVSFGPALPVGMESLAEYFVMDLPAPLSAPDETAELLTANLPRGLSVQSVSLHPSRVPQDVLNTYRIVLPREIAPEETARLHLFVNAPSFSVVKIRKGKSKTVDIRPLIRRITLEGAGTLVVQTVNRAGVPGIKVQEALQQILGLDQTTLLAAHMQKIAWARLTDPDVSD